MAAKKTINSDGQDVAEQDVIASPGEPAKETGEPTESTGSQAAPEAEQLTQDFATGASSACAKLNSAQPLDGAVAESVVYIGPSLPYGKIRSSMILKGTQEEIDGFLAEIKEQYPEVTHLLVPPDKLTQALEKVGRKGTILHKYYEDMLAKSRASRKGQG